MKYFQVSIPKGVMKGDEKVRVWNFSYMSPADFVFDYITNKSREKRDLYLYIWAEHQ